MTALRKGDKVRVTFEATYDEKSHGTDAGGHWLQTADAPITYVPADATIEPVEDLRLGDVYRSYERTVAYVGPADRPWVVLHNHQPGLFSAGATIQDSYVSRPLTLLVRDGKPVTS